MKQNTKLLFTAGLILSVFSSGTAVSLNSSLAQPFSNQLVQDIDTYGSAFFEDVVTPGETTETVGDSTVSLSGSGSVVIMSNGQQGYPRTLVIGGTTITSNRSVNAVDAKPWWQGELKAPRRIAKPTSVTISGVDSRSIEIVDAFAVGAADGSEVSLRSEFLTFSPSATLAFRTNESEGQKLWVAHRGAEGYKASENDYCIVDSDGDCFYSFSGGNYIALAKGSFSECPVSNVPNGTVAEAPGCSINCHSGYELDMTGSQCIEKDYTYSSASKSTAESASEAVGAFVQEINEYEPTRDSAPAQAFAGDAGMVEVEEGTNTVPDGYFRYRRDPNRETIAISDDMDAEDRHLVGKLNAGLEYSQRPSETAEKELLYAANADTKTGERDDGRLSYMIQMRNYFGSGSQPNVFGDETQVASNSNITSSDDESEETHSSAPEEEEEELDELYAVGPLLPSTGPSWFLIIALLGIAMMVFSSRQRN